MTLDVTRACELLVGLEDMAVLAVDEEGGGGQRVMVESRDRRVGCAGCGTRAQVKDRPVVELGDLASFGRGRPPRRTDRRGDGSRRTGTGRLGRRWQSRRCS